MTSPNTERRLAHHGARIGLLTPSEYETIRRHLDEIDRHIDDFRETVVPAAKIPFDGLRKQGGATVAELLRIPGVVFADLHEFGAPIPELESDIADAVEVSIKYEGYIERQQRQIEQFRRLESQRIPSGFRYSDLSGLRREAEEKFTRIRPLTLGQASRIPGITSSDVAILMIHLRGRTTVVTQSS